MIFINHKQEVLSAVDRAIQRGLEICGGKAERYAKKLSPVDTGRLRNSITHAQMDTRTEVIGSNVKYAKFQELGYHRGDTYVAGKHFLRSAAEGQQTSTRP